MYSGTEMGVPAMLPNTMSGSWQERTYDVFIHFSCDDPIFFHWIRIPLSKTGSDLPLTFNKLMKNILRIFDGLNYRYYSNNEIIWIYPKYFFLYFEGIYDIFFQWISNYRGRIRKWKHPCIRILTENSWVVFLIVLIYIFWCFFGSLDSNDRSWFLVLREDPRHLDEPLWAHYSQEGSVRVHQQSRPLVQIFHRHLRRL